MWNIGLILNQDCVRSLCLTPMCTRYLSHVQANTHTHTPTNLFSLWCKGRSKKRTCALTAPPSQHPDPRVPDSLSHASLSLLRLCVCVCVCVAPYRKPPTEALGSDTDPPVSCLLSPANGKHRGQTDPWQTKHVSSSFLIHPHTHIQWVSIMLRHLRQCLFHELISIGYSMAIDLI